MMRLKSLQTMAVVLKALLSGQNLRLSKYMAKRIPLYLHNAPGEKG
jgi:hypothetical protein